MDLQFVSFGGAARSPRAFPWKTLLVAGALVALAGAGMLVWPFVSASWIVGLCCGAALVASGVAVAARGGGSLLAVLGGGFLVLAGVLAMVFGPATATALVSFAGIGMLSLGVLWVVAAAGFGGRAGARTAVLAAAPGVLLTVGGVVALLWPQIALAILAVVGGIVLLALGALLISTALRMRDGGAGPGTAAADPSRATIIIDPPA